MEDSFVAKLNQYIYDNMEDSNLTVGKLATYCYISRSSLYSLIIKHTKQTPAKYIRQLRLEQAYKLLTTKPNVRVIEVMYLVGFTDKTNFHKLFKEKFGVTPGSLIGELPNEKEEGEEE